MPTIRLLLLSTIFCASVLRSVSAAEVDVVNSPVPVVLQDRFHVQPENGAGDIPIRVSRDWTFAQTDVTRAVIIIHGWPRRDIDADKDLQQRAGALAEGTLFITPQFLTATDVTAHHLSSTTLQWQESGWLQGYDAKSPSPISSFTVMDAIFAHLADRTLFPNLKDVVLAGHSAGGQFVQRYAVVGRGEMNLIAAGIHVRYVAANPAAYLYFGDERPQPDGSFADARASCPGVSTWNNGLAAKLPTYLTRPVSPGALEDDYLQRDVIYLLGTADNDPNADALGQACAFKSQGATRLERGHAYFRYITAAADTARLPQRHRLLEVPGVAHRTFAMYHSVCGLAALFDKPGCVTTP
ncbi:alpha/beta hydrolase [Herbaspirillum rhizosphaerae]|uniref:Alpha/beta hydrolase n=1 Tax=Herbaspirillum rhizosphaerae TaxID=346179 RepID=A0ABW8Z5L1_9BURK